MEKLFKDLTTDGLSKGCENDFQKIADWCRLKNIDAGKVFNLQKYETAIELFNN